MPDLGVVVGRLAGPRDLVRRRSPRCVALDRKAHLPGRFDNLTPALRPVRDQRRRFLPDGSSGWGKARNAGELIVLAVLLHVNAKPVPQVPRQGIAVDRPCRLHPGIDRVLVQRPVLAVPVRSRGIEDCAMGMKLRIVLAARAMLEHRAHDVRRHDPGSVSFLKPRPGAIPQHRLCQCGTGCVIVRALDLRTQLRIGNSPQGGDALVGAERHVEAGRALLASGIARQPLSTVGGEAMIQPVELSAINPAAVGKPEQAAGVPPHAIRFLARRVVLVGMTEGALALKVIGCRGHLGQRRYHVFRIPNLTGSGFNSLRLSFTLMPISPSQAPWNDNLQDRPIAPSQFTAEVCIAYFAI